MFKNYIINNKFNIIENVCDLISYPSISVENDSNYVFGKSCDDALKYFLKIADKLGFRVKNVDGYCGWAEFGEGEELIGIIGHLDVVPADEKDWSYYPFIPTISNNKIYGRGAIDDKGPVIASLYAMKAVMDYAKDNNISINKRIRLIVGLNEEKNWKCIKYYKANEEIPTFGFSTDSDFPCIYSEKGVISLSIFDNLSSVKSFSNSHNYAPILLESIDYNSNPINVVPNYCSAILKVINNTYINSLLSVCKKIINKYNYNMELDKLDDTHIKITSHGRTSHSAHPENGNNAISKLIIVLNEIFTSFHLNIPLLSTFCKYIGDDFNGKNMDLNINDESGNLTLNVSQFYIKDNKVYINIDLRVPVHCSQDIIINRFKDIFKNIYLIKINEPLFIDKKSDLVQILCSVYNKVCNTNLEPISIGGATYARAFPNCISFGMNFPNDKDMCHQVDEFVDIDKLILATNIYAEAIYKLLQ